MISIVNSVVTFGIGFQLGGIIKSVAASKTTVIIPASAIVDELIVNFLSAIEWVSQVG